MRRFDVWVEYYDFPDTFETEVAEVTALTAKQAMMLGLGFLTPYIPDGLSCEEISIIVQAQEEDDTHD